MAIIPQAGYEIDPNNPNAVRKIQTTAMPGSLASIQQQSPSIAYGAVNNVAIPAQQTQTPVPANIKPAPVDTTNYAGILEGAKNQALQIQEQIKKLPTETPQAPAPVQEPAWYQKILSQLEMPSAPSSLESAYTTERDNAGIDAKTQAVIQSQQELDLINAQIQGIVDEATATNLGLENQGGAITAGGVQRSSQANVREAAIKALPLQAQALAKQAQLTGNQATLKMAEDKLNTIFTIKSKDIENKYQYDMDRYKTLYQVANDAQKQALDEKRLSLEAAKFDATQFNDLAKSYVTAAIQAGDFATAGKLALATTPEELNRLSSGIVNNNPDLQFVSGTDNQPSGYFNKSTGVFTPFRVGGGSGGIGGTPSLSQYSGVIDTILASGKFTKDQAARVTKAINSGEDPITVIKNQAIEILGTEGKDLRKYESAKTAMQQLDGQLQQFYANGGKSGIFSGNFEKVANNLGKVNDPGLVDIAVQIAASLQKYRNAISGTAYSEQEGKDIASIFPGITKGQILNNTIIQARIKTLDSDIDGLYTQAIGANAYSKIKSNQQMQVQSTPASSSGTTSSGVKYTIVGGTTTGATPTVNSSQTNLPASTPTTSYKSLLPDFSSYKGFSLDSFFK